MDLSSQPKTQIHLKVEQLRNGENPQALCRLPSGWALLGDRQFLPGYCLIFPDPVVANLNALNVDQRMIFTRDMSLIGDAVLRVTGAARINYEILGNADPALHAHVFPRFHDEPEALKTKSAFFYDWDAAPKFDFKIHRRVMTDIAHELHRQMIALGLSCEVAPQLI